MAKKSTKPPASISEEAGKPASTKKDRSRSKSSKTFNPITGVTEQEERFVQAYLVDFNGTQAALSAGYGGGSNAKSAGVMATRLLARPNIKARITAIEKPVFDQYEISKERIMREVALCAFSNMGDYTRIMSDGSLITDFTTVTRDQMAALSQVEVTEMAPVMTVTSDGLPIAREVVKIKVKTVDKLAALDKLMKRHGLIKEYVEITHKNDLSVLELARRMAYMLSQGAREVPSPPAQAALPVEKKTNS